MLLSHLTTIALGVCCIRKKENDKKGGRVCGQNIWYHIAPDMAAYCVITQFRERENAIKFISVRTKTQ